MSEGRVATIDADGHVIEPADLWERELPPSLRARGFHIRWDAETEQEQGWEDWDRTSQLARPLPVCETRLTAPRSAGQRGDHQRPVTRCVPGLADGDRGLRGGEGGLVTLTYYLASEYGADNVRANCIAPGPVPTDLNRPFLGTPEGRAMTAAFIPLGRVGVIDDVAWAAVFLASDAARWLTGAVLRVDGGIVVQ